MEDTIGKKEKDYYYKDYKDEVEFTEMERNPNVDLDSLTFRAYKQFKTKYRPDKKRTEKYKGWLFPLFISANKGLQIGKWYKSGEGKLKIKVDAKTGEPILKNGKPHIVSASKLGDLSYRPGWHMGSSPVTRHIGKGKKNDNNEYDYMHPENVWCEVEYSAKKDFTDETPKYYTADGKIDKQKSCFDKLDSFKDGFYHYKTNPNATDEEDWLIADAIKIIRVIPDEEVERIASEHGLKAQLRDIKKSGGDFIADFDQFNESQVCLKGKKLQENKYDFKITSLGDTLNTFTVDAESEQDAIRKVKGSSYYQGLKSDFEGVELVCTNSDKYNNNFKLTAPQISGVKYLANSDFEDGCKSSFQVFFRTLGNRLSWDLNDKSIPFDKAYELYEKLYDEYTEVRGVVTPKALTKIGEEIVDIIKSKGFEFTPVESGLNSKETIYYATFCKWYKYDEDFDETWRYRCNLQVNKIDEGVSVSFVTITNEVPSRFYSLFNDLYKGVLKDVDCEKVAEEFIKTFNEELKDEDLTIDSEEKAKGLIEQAEISESKNIINEYLNIHF